MLRLLRSWLGLALLALTGCGGEAKLSPVQGRVLFNGRPLPGGTIVFTPDRDRGNSGPMATAEIHQDGRYVLTTGGQPGAVPGWHRVTVAPPSIPQRADSPSPLNLPRHFSHSEQSGQCQEVKTGSNTIDIPLE